MRRPSALARLRGQVEEAKRQDPFQEWMDQITTASLPWKIADFDAQAGSQWVEINATSQFTLGGSDVTVRYEVHGASLGRGSVSVPVGNYMDVYHGEFTTRLTLLDPSGVVTSGMASVHQCWIADGVGTIKEVLASSAETEDGGYTITKTSDLVGGKSARVSTVSTGTTFSLPTRQSTRASWAQLSRING